MRSVHSASVYWAPTLCQALLYIESSKMYKGSLLLITSGASKGDRHLNDKCDEGSNRKMCTINECMNEGEVHLSLAIKEAYGEETVCWMCLGGRLSTSGNRYWWAHSRSPAWARTWGVRGQWLRHHYSSLSGIDESGLDDPSWPRPVILGTVTIWMFIWNYL